MGFHYAPWAQCASLAVWAAGFFLDARITVRSGMVLRYESNPVFFLLASRLGPARALPAQAAFEAALGVAAGLLIGGSSGAAPVASVGAVFGLAHMLAWHSNRKFLASLARQQP